MAIESITYRNRTFRYRARGNGLNSFVFAVVKDYVAEHGEITFEQLRLIFPDELQNNTARPGTILLGVFATIQTAMEIKQHAGLRYFVENNKQIVLRDGATIVVSDQWGSDGARANVQRFIERVKSLGENLKIEFRLPN